MENHDDIKKTVAKNILQLRNQKKMTQLELASVLNYSDKAVSKWERGESLPDVVVLIQIAQYYEVPLQYLVEETHISRSEQRHEWLNQAKSNHRFITAISIVSVFLFAMLLFNILEWSAGRNKMHYLAYIYAVPVAFTVWLVLNSIWFNSRTNFRIISLLMWTLLAACFLNFMFLGYNIWMIFLLGIPGQIIIILTSHLRPTKS